MKYVNPLLAALMLRAGIVPAFNSGQTGWKLDAEGRIVMKDGNPVYIQKDGSESTVEANTVSRLNAEAKRNREAFEEANAKLAAFEGLDATKAKEALQKLADIDQSKLIDAGRLDEVRNQITQQFQAQIAERDAALTQSKAETDKLLLDAAFNGSEFLRNNLTLPLGIARDHFGKHFKVENGKVVPSGPDGNVLYSKTRMGEIANFDEAVAQLVDIHPNKNDILRANTGNGTGSTQHGGPGSRFVRRADFEKLNPSQQAETAAKARTGEVSIID